MSDGLGPDLILTVERLDDDYARLAESYALEIEGGDEMNIPVWVDEWRLSHEALRSRLEFTIKTLTEVTNKYHALDQKLSALSVAHEAAVKERDKWERDFQEKCNDVVELAFVEAENQRLREALEDIAEQGDESERLGMDSTLVMTQFAREALASPEETR